MSTIPAQILDNGERLAGRTAYATRSDGVWTQVTWDEYAAQIRTAARALIAHGVQSGDRVAILGWNRPAWTILDVAAMAIGAVPVGIYPTSSTEECDYVLNHSGAVVLLVQNEEQWAKIEPIKNTTPSLRRVVTMPESTGVSDHLVSSWDDFLAAAKGATDDDVQARLTALEAQNPATLIYTSGTTGPPKAVMLSHENLTWTSAAAVAEVDIGPDDSLMSYLPLCHIAEQLLTIHGAAASGHQVYYVDDILQLANYLKEVRPTVFFAVPRVWEKFRTGISDELGTYTGLKASIAARAQEVSKQVHAARNEGNEPGFATRLQYQLFAGLVYSKVKQAVGLDRAKLTISGAAPIAPELVEFFAGFDLPVLQHYGQSENTGLVSLNLPGRNRYGTAGQVFPGIEVSFADDDEILVRGRNVFLGYFKDEEATAKDLRDGWLHTGDLGELDDDGYLRITGRKKDIIITAAGKNITPSLIEERLKADPLIDEAVVIGDRQRYLTALIVPNPDVVPRYADEAAVRATIDDHIDEVNQNFARAEQIKKYTLLDRELSIDTGELTPTLKVKRSAVNESFAGEIAAMYAE